jgi:hypothetical protein
VYSVVRSDNMVVLSVDSSNVNRMAQQLMKTTSIDKGKIHSILVPKNIDIICFINDLVLKNKVGSKYLISGKLESFHPDDYIFHQSKMSGDQCNIFIKDTFDEMLMGGEACPGTLALVEFYKNAYAQVSSTILNKNSLFARSAGGFYSIIERNMAEFVVYLSWTKLNEVIKYFRSFNTGENFDLASTFELVERTDGIAFDIVRRLKESKDSSFFMLDGKTGSKIKMMVDGTIPDATSELTAEFYHNEFLNNLSAYRNGTVNTLTNAIKSVDERIQRSMSSGIKTGMQLSASLIKQGWVIEVVDGAECFVYHDKVYANSVVGGSNMKRYTFPKECENLLYLYDITVPIETVMRSGIAVSENNKGVRARGFFPHRSAGSVDVYEEVKAHKNLGRMCIGDLDNKPIEKIVNLLDAFSCVYQPSMMGNLPSKCISSLFGNDISVMSSGASKENIEKAKEYIKPFIDNKGILNKLTASKKASESGARMSSIFTVDK